MPFTERWAYQTYEIWKGYLVMKQSTEKKLILILIAGCLLFLFLEKLTAPIAEKESEAGDPKETEQVAQFADSLSQRRVIYTCRLGSEDIPAVQIWEVKDADAPATTTFARVDAATEIEVTTHETSPIWDYKSISAHDGENAIEVAFIPEEKRAGFDWVITLKDKDTYFKQRVRDCTEVSDE
jgi:hypothetical protein